MGMCIHEKVNGTEYRFLLALACYPNDNSGDGFIDEKQNKQTKCKIPTMKILNHDGWLNVGDIVSFSYYRSSKQNAYPLLDKLTKKRLIECGKNLLYCDVRGRKARKNFYRLKKDSITMSLMWDIFFENLHFLYDKKERFCGKEQIKKIRNEVIALEREYLSLDYRYMLGRSFAHITQLRSYLLELSYFSEEPKQLLKAQNEYYSMIIKKCREVIIQNKKEFGLLSKRTLER